MRALHLFTTAALSALLVAGCSSSQTTRATPRAAGANPSIGYRVTVDGAGSTDFRVSATINGIVADTMTFYFPIWAPGAYDIVNFGAYVHDFTATSGDGRTLAVLRGDTNTFRIVGPGPELRLTYQVHEIESAPNSVWFGLSDIEPDYAYANATALFGYPAGYKELPYTVTYVPPAGWDLTVGLDPVPGQAHTYRAVDYDELVDAPVQMGKFQLFEFTSQGKPHIISVTAPEKLDTADQRDLIDMTRKVVDIETKFFGDMPYNRYVFQHYLVNPKPGELLFGALEHANSSTYRMPYRKGSMAENLSAVVAHEFWHLWSPKRIHVAELGPFNYQDTPRTKSLWFAEGLTEYYAQLLLLRNGMGDSTDFLGSLSSFLDRTYRQPQQISLTDISYHFSDLDPGQAIAIYSKGPVVGLLLDAAIRSQTGNAKSLDDAMRYFNDQYGKTRKTFSDNDIIPVMERVTGAKLAEFYSKYIDGRDPLPFDDYLPAIGLKVVYSKVNRPTLGAVTKQTDKGVQIISVVPGGTADSTGLKPGDQIATIDLTNVGAGSYPLSQSGETVMTQVLSQVPAWLRFNVKVLRDGATIDKTMKLVATEVDQHGVGVDPAASPQAVAIRRSMLGM